MSTHEDFSRDETIEGSTDRGFGLTVGGILLAIALVRLGLGWWQTGEVAFGWVNMVLGGVGIVLLTLGQLAPSSLAPLNRAWTKLGLVLFKIVNPIVLGLIFVSTVLPIGLLIRAFGKDPLRLRFDPEASSYWIMRDPPGPSPESMKQQF
ncbi:MAG: SxtJ family membrane protein [Geminicoccaceae bacterium]